MEGDAHHLELIPLKPNQHKVTLLPKATTDLPFFYLTKQPRLLRQPIRFEGVDQAGRSMRWTVTPNPSPSIGAPGIDAHEAWVRLVMPAINARREPSGKVPSIVPLGRLREALRIIGWGEGGWEARRLLRSLRQIGAAWCVADLWIPTSESDEQGNPKLVHVKGEYSRMTIYAVGSTHLTDEQVRDGSFDFDFDLEDTVYVQLHALEATMQANQPAIPTDNQYMFSVGPAARRWLDLMRGKIFGTIKNRKPYCQVKYSWYVRHHHTLKPYISRKRVVLQMNRVVKDHLRSGYLERVEYRSLKEPGKETDFLIRYFPGPEARASVERMNPARSRRKHKTEAPLYTDGEISEIDARYIEEPPARATSVAREEGRAHPLLPELTRRGVAPAVGEKLLGNLAEGQAVEDQLEWIDSLVAAGDKRNPPGLYVSLIRDNVAVPENFETARKRKLREDAQAARDQEHQRQAQLKLAYERYQDEEIDSYIAENESEYERLKAAKTVQFGNSEAFSHFRPEMLALMVEGAVTAAIRQRIAFTTFEEFCRQHGEAEATMGKVMTGSSGEVNSNAGSTASDPGSVQTESPEPSSSETTARSQPGSGIQSQPPTGTPQEGRMPSFPV